MSVIASHTFGNDVSKYLTIGEDASHTDLRRTFDWGSNWYAVRIGVMLEIEYTGNGTFTAFDAAWGLCSGTSNPYSSATCANFLGYQFGTTIGGANFSAGTDQGGATTKKVVLTAGTSSNQFVHKHNTTRTFTALASAFGGVGGISTRFAGAERERTMHFLDIKKPRGSAGAVGTNYLISNAHFGNSTAYFRGANQSDRMFWDIMNLASTPVSGTTNLYNYGTASGSAETSIAVATVDEPTNGLFDGFNIHWNAQSATYALNVHRVAVARLM